MWRVSLLSVLAAVLLLCGVTQGARDVTKPGDPVVAIPNNGNWPANEAVDQAIDDQIVTKFLHFSGATEPTGFTVTPKVGATLVTGINLCSANDAAERDPVKYELSGSNGSIDGPWTVISAGDIKDFAGSAAWARRTMLSKPITFANTVSYKYYKLMFPACRGPAQNSMQIAEVELLSAVYTATIDPTGVVNGATGVTLALLKWIKGDTAATHTVYIGTDPAALVKQVNPMGPTITMFMYAATVPGTTYYWRVDEKDAKGNVYTGDVWSFSIQPVTANNPIPLDGDKWQDVDVDLSWSPGQAAQKHDVYFGLDQALVAARDPSTLKAADQLAMSYDPGTLAAKTTYYWAVDETPSMGDKVAGPVWSFTTIGPNAGGIKGEYFNNQNLSGLPALTRIDQTIDVTAAIGAPVIDSGWSARWTADLEIIKADTYMFALNCHAFTRMSIDGQLIIDKWPAAGVGAPTVVSKYFSLPVPLAKGVHSLQVEYVCTGTFAETLSWSTATMAEVIVPAGPLQPPVHAKATYPQDKDANVPQDVTLTWSTGNNAATHDVYFGDVAADVAAATPATAGIYQGSQAADKNTFAPGALQWNKTYYWRIDEVNAAEADSPWKGAVWSFTTADFIVVDDFEGYTDNDVGRIFQTWIDGWGFTTPEPGNPGNGTGATVGYIDPPFAEHTTVHGGGSSMPLGYNNADSPNYSETERTFDAPQNWTVNGVNTLSLQVRGYPQVTTTAVTETGGKMTLTGSGTDIWNNSDDFTYAYKSLNGDGTLVAKVTSNGTGTNAWAKGGVMIRDSLDGGSMQALMAITANSATAAAGNGASFQYRNATNGASGNVDATSVVAPPYWVKVERIGDTFTGYTSADGSSWQMLGTQDIVMTNPVCIGIAVTSHVAGEQRTYQFESIKTTGSVTGAWQGAAISSPRYNSPQNLYVALQDSTGKVAVVTDATAVNSATWVEVRMPLSSFTSVSASKIKKMFIGVGDRNAPVADGTGMLFIDDIRVIKP
jgi:hypothetical protein